MIRIFRFRSPAHSESVSDESDPSVCSERSQSLLNVDADLFDNVRQFNVSYHKVNQKTDEKLSNRAAHVAQVCAIPVHSYVVNETHASPIREEERPPLQPSGDLNSKSEFIGRTKQGRCFKKSISLPTNNGFRAPESDSHHVESSGPAFTKKKPFVTVNDISLRTRPSRLPPPSRPPPVFAARKGGPGRPISELRAANSYAFERVVDEGSPPFYDVQIDASSSKEAPVATEIAMEKAQEKIGSAKESMEKKEVPQSCLKVHAQDSNQIVEKMINKAYSGAATCMDDMVQEMLKGDGSGMQPIAKVSPAVIQVSEEEESDLIDREKYIDLVEKPIHRRQNKESSPQVSHKPIGTFAWRQETEYFEVIETDIPFKAVEQYKDDKSNVLQDIGSEEYTHATVASTEASQPHEFIKEVEVEAPKLEETRSLLETRKNTREWSDNRGRSNKTMETRFQKENQNNAEVDFKSCESEMGKKRLKKVKQHVDKKIEQDADKCAGNVAKAEHHVAEVEVKGKPNATNERTDSCKVILDVHAKKANERRSRECIMMEGCDKKLEDAVEKVEDVKGEVQQEEREHQEESSKKGEKEKNRKQVNQGKENQNKLKEAIQQEGYAKRFHMSIQHEENKTSFRTSEQEDKDRHQNPDYEMEGTKQRVQETHSSVDEGRQYHKACEIGELDVRLTDIWKQEPSKNGSTVAFEEEVTKENSRLTSVSEGSQDLSKNTMKHEKLRKHTEDANPIKWDGDGRMGNQEQGIDGPREGLHINSLDGACKLKDNTHQTLTAAQAPISCEEDKKPGTKDGDQEVGARTSELQGEEISFSLGKNKHDLQHEEYKIHLEDDTKLPCSHEHVIDSNPAGTGIGNSANKQDKEVSQVASDPEKKRVNTHEKGHKGKVTNRVQMSFSEEITKENSTTYQVFTELTGDGKNIGAALPSMLNDRKNLNTHQRGTNQNAETKERHPNVTLAPEDRKIEERLDQERELEKEHLRRMEEEKEREREREKDRMAVDRAALEARERSYSEARERAERAAIGRTTAEVRQRVAMEARGRLDKEAMEARIRAERAAVERATAEARQRAFEKAMAEKASFETRERVERSVSDKLYASSRNAEMRPSSVSIHTLNVLIFELCGNSQFIA